MKLAYVLARKDFFELGCNGRVTHAKGIVSGLLGNEVSVDVFSSKSTSKHIHSTTGNLLVIPLCNCFFWYLHCVFELLKRKNDYDFVIVRYSTSLGWLNLFLFTMMFGNRWGFEVNGLGYHQWSSGDSYKKRLISKIIKPIEQFLISRAPFLNCVSGKLKNELSQFNRNVVELPNAGELLPYEKIKTKKSTKKKLIYFGMYHHYYSLVEAAKTISNNSSFELHLHGAGEQEEELKKISKSCDNVFVYGRYNLNQLIENGGLDGDCYLLLPYKEGTIADYGSPTKLFEYLALGLPIISTSFGQPYDILAKRKNISPESVYFYKNSIDEVLPMIYSNNTELDKNEIVTFFSNEHTWISRCEQYLIEIKKHLGSDVK
ncbi:glycosyltransferase [Vibrio vulnificus]|uniref:Glycosyltransferase n=3 Tax=Vibrio vulnificus TaxID=672 RepID=A0A3Q0MF47_VIBVU|nr:glycosyltransferase [Vibrio vulnificus]ADV91928.1 hypothetical protein VV1_3213 [Vibrio vulnificus CMCP6]AUJ33956.1 hypothetical protein BWZ32_03180 [Vibrio vulnificus]EGQ7957761.1 glycosyltransferase family 4 protein [Vibrio vulnificus]EGQ8174760.1 glycosyltransferase family 4 protein [Vibrio vulnificus]EGQ9939555.1 glycosyltransferase family 4 protein [Vibrio vulnificus]